ncbi:MAG: hypothetical protein QM775_20740 [Pirellulales bacterium]
MSVPSATGPSAGPNLTTPAISTSAVAAPNLATPIVPQADDISVAPNLPTPVVASRPQLPATANVVVAQEYRPSPIGFTLHGGHKPGPRPAVEQPEAIVPSIPTPVVASPVVTTPAIASTQRPTLAPPMTATARVEPKIARPENMNPSRRAEVTDAGSRRARSNQATGRRGRSSETARTRRRRTAPAAVVNPTQSLPKPATVATPQSVAPAAAPKSWWPRPVELFDRLAGLQEIPATKPWADRAIALLDDLSSIEDSESSRAAQIVQQLRALLADPRLLDETRLDAKTGLQVRLTRHALQRRLDVWESLLGVLGRQESAVASRADAEDLAVCLVQLERETAAAGETGRQWRDYLMLDQLGSTVRNAGDDVVRRELARDIIQRMRRAAEGDQRNEFLTQGSFAELNQQLLTLADADLDGRTLLESIERFEGGGLPSDGHALAEQCKLLDYSNDPARRQLATWLTSHYRNANVRVTISADLLNRMLPEELRQNAAVNDTVLGLPTQGWSSTRTGVGIAFIPSNESLAVRMTAQGTVHAQTQTFSGPVRLFNHSDSSFRAHKDFSLTHRGVEVQPATASTASRSRLQGIRTDFDHMPILGGIVESIAMDQHAEKKVPAQREAAAKVSRQVERGLDHELDKHLRTANGQLNDYIVTPLAKVGLSPDLIELQSNEARAIMRVRIAGENQLASHTPRPRAYSDNVASVQVHQSAINNVLERLGFQGRHFTAAELYSFAVKELYVPDVVDPAHIPDDISITFAKTDPITIHCANGHVELRLAIEELRRGTKSWRDFTVRTEFKTQIVDGATCFVRDGLIHLSGNRLSTTSQIALRTVFAKVFADDMCLPLWPEKMRTDKRFADLDIAQVDIRDGWIGMAVGPRRVQTTMGLLRPRR